MRGGAWLPADESAVVGRNVRALRLRRKWSQADLCERAGCWTPAEVSRFESCTRRFRREHVPFLAGLFGVTVEFLMTGCGNCEGRPIEGYACLTCGAEGVRRP